MGVEAVVLEEMTDEERKGDSKERKIAQMYWNYAVERLEQIKRKLLV